MQIKACGVLIVTGQPPERFLLMVHHDRLDLPKGHVEAGESELQCALRELREETGIQAADIAVDPTFRFTTSYQVRSKFLGGQLFDKTVVIFLARLIRDVPIQVTEHVGYRWHDWSPPHRIQQATIDPLLAAVERHLTMGGHESAGS